jgi:hypothetical protein
LQLACEKGDVASEAKDTFEVTFFREFSNLINLFMEPGNIVSKNDLECKSVDIREVVVDFFES